MNMKTITQFLLTVFAATLALSANTENEKPYEFGFSIDGQQHRHEKRDERGIVQGEFGFITADGIYHVTVYATDENGKFKILKTRNIRISAPLDGSPLRGEISPEAEKYRKQAGLPPLPAGGSSPVPSPTPSPVAIPNPVVTNNPAPFAFTTQPTVKPACASCGYITTAAPVPGQSGANTFQFQNPVFSTQDQSQYQQPQYQQSGPVSGSNLPGVPQGPQGPRGPHGPPGPNVPPYEATKGPQYTNYQTDQIGQNPAGNGGSVPAGLPVPSYSSDGGFAGSPQFGPAQNYPGDGASAGLPDSGSGQNVPGFGGNPPTSFPASSYPSGGAFVGSPVPGSAPSIAGYPGDGSLPGSSASGPVQNIPGYPSDGGFSGNTFGNNNNAIGEDGLLYDTGVIYGQNGFASNGPAPPTTDILPPIEVSNNVIHVGGSHPQDIPIKDKYPGMQDGLPAGINEKDITDILYKFHYTVGFHGHYEKGYKNGAKIGGYFVNGRDGISRVVTYVADENGYRPKVKLINLGLDSSDTPKPDSEKTFGLQSFEFVWYPVD